MATKKTTTKPIAEEEIKEAEVIVTEENIKPETKRPCVIAKDNTVTVYSTPCYDKKFKTGIMPAFTEYEILDIVNSTIYGTFYKIDLGFISKENNLALIN